MVNYGVTLHANFDPFCTSEKLVTEIGRTLAWTKPVNFVFDL